MSRLVLCIVAAAAFWWLKNSAVVTPVIPVTPPSPVVVPSGPLADIASKMTRDDRTALALAYDVLSRSVAANPTSDPVFPTTGSVRAAHRAALLCVWKGVLNNNAGKYPGLREALEGAVEKRIGTDDIPLNPALQAEAAKAFADIAATVR